MLDLINVFSLSDIIIFTIMAALAIKGILSFFQWIGDRGVKFFNYKYFKPKELEDTVTKLMNNVNNVTDKVNLLIDSDKDDIKAFIIREHHYFCYQLKEIDDQSLECIERRYEHYKREGGNTYIPDLMQDLRALPKTLPSAMKKYHQQPNPASEKKGE